MEHMIFESSEIFGKEVLSSVGDGRISRCMPASTRSQQLSDLFLPFHAVFLNHVKTLGKTFSDVFISSDKPLSQRNRVESEEGCSIRGKVHYYRCISQCH